MVHVATTLLIAVDHLTTAVIDTLSSGYCPTSKTLFLMRLSAFVATFGAVAAGLIAVARFRLRNSTFEIATYTSAVVLIVFAIGAGALNVFGLSGCSGNTIAGLIRDWPW